MSKSGPPETPRENMVFAVAFLEGLKIGPTRGQLECSGEIRVGDDAAWQEIVDERSRAAAEVADRCVAALRRTGRQ